MDAKDVKSAVATEAGRRLERARIAAERRALAGHTPNCPMDGCPLIASCQIQRLRNELAVARAQVRAARAAIRTAVHASGDYSLRLELGHTLLAKVDRAGKPAPRAGRGIR